MAKKLHLLLMGKTGHGKSATGNTILGRRVFKTSSNGKSETFEVEDDYAEFEGRTLHVIDGPGLADTEIDKVKDTERTVKNMSMVLFNCSEGVDAFIFVLKFKERFTTEERATLETLKRIFGHSYLNHLIVIITGGDDFQDAMEEEGKNVSFHQWCSQQEGEMLKLYNDCQNRFLLFNNREKVKEKNNTQILELVHMVEYLQAKNGRYTSQCFDFVKAQREKMIVDLKAPDLREEIQENIALLSADIVKYSQEPNDSLRENIRQRIKDFKDKVHYADKGYGVLSDLFQILERAEQNLGDAEKLLSFGQELEKWRKAKRILSVTWNIVSVVGGVLSFVCPAAAAVTTAVRVITALRAATAISAISTGVTGLVTCIGKKIATNKETELEQMMQEIKCKPK